MSDVSKWGKSSALNKDTSPDGAQDGWTGSAVGPWARETMAGVARWYADTAFTSPLFDMDSTNVDKTVGISGTDITITGFTSDASNHFPEGRLLKITDSGGSTAVGFIASSSYAGTTMSVTMDYITAPPGSGATDVDNVQFAVMGEDTGSGNFAKATNALGGQLIGPTVLSGGGTTAMRDAKFATVATTPDGILWYNTTTDTLEVTASGAWIPSNHIYYDPGNTRLVLENGDWTSGSGVHGRIYIDDADGKLYHQTRTNGADDAALSLTPGSGEGMTSEFAEKINTFSGPSHYSDHTSLLLSSVSHTTYPSYTHGRGAYPLLVTLRLHCNVADSGSLGSASFSVGDVIPAMVAYRQEGSYATSLGLRWELRDTNTITIIGGGDTAVANPGGIPENETMAFPDPRGYDGMIRLTPSKWQLWLDAWF